MARGYCRFGRCLTVGVFLAAAILLLPLLSFAANSANATCLACHWRSNLRSSRLLAHSFYVDPKKLGASVHGALSCTSCHRGEWTFPHKFSKIQPVQCGTCHTSQAKAFSKSLHSMMMVPAAEEPGSPDSYRPRPVTCSSCHGKHYIRRIKNPKSPIFPTNQVKTCGGCHKKTAPSRGRRQFGEKIENYVDSVHGRAVLVSGLVNSAVCTNCHRSHDILPATDPQSSVSRSRITETCGKCHVGIVKRMKKDVHGMAAAKGVGGTPVCTDCHTSHTIERTVLSHFRLSNPIRCGKCHEKQLRTYRLSQHGKAGYLHSAEAADCSDCHLAHLTKSANLMRKDADEFAGMCRKCHRGAGPMLVSFQPHADPSDKRAYPLLYWTWLGMHSLIISVIGFFGAHTLLWFPRSWWGRRKAPPRRGDNPTEPLKYYYRFDELSRFLHFLVIFSFTGLAVTGIPLRYSHTEWAQSLATYTVFATREVAGGFHRFFALMTFGYFILHFIQIMNRVRLRNESLTSLFFGPDSLVPSRKDFVQVWQHLRFFVGKGPRPKFDRWTYWEKFDYWAVFWGVAVIGGSGLMLWFPIFFTRFLPGWTLNMAQIIHSEEALLAVSFIFVVHFFHNVLRGEKFPIDTTMFTGRISEEVFREEHPEEYERLRLANRLMTREAPPPTEEEIQVARIVFGFALLMGVMILVALIFSVVL